MSSLLLRIPYQLARSLPWDALYGLFQLKRGITELETVLQLQRGTLSKAQREYPAHKQGKPVRGISAKVHQHILDRMAEKFQTGEQMRAWIKKNWSAELLELSAKYLDGLYDMLDLAHQIPQVGVFPKDHIPRKKGYSHNRLEIIKLHPSGCDFHVHREPSPESGWNRAIVSILSTPFPLFSCFRAAEN